MTSLQSVRHTRGKGPRPEFPRNSDVKRAGRDCSQWLHIQGTEYLVANPVEIPGLEKLITSCRTECHAPNQSFPLSVCGPSLKSSNKSLHGNSGLSSNQRFQLDLFEKLPPEVRYMILQDLQAKDIANLRLVTRAFRQLPTTLFRKLLLEDMPFLWEAYDLAIGSTNWLKLYTNLHRQEFKGLDNRERIWEDITEILRRIEVYRAEGIIEDGQDVNM